MNFELIVAMSNTGVIGNENKIPWNVPEDMSHFKQMTNNSIVIMGRNTFGSLPNGPLKNRINIVLSKTPHLETDSDSIYNNVFFTDFDNVKQLLENICQKNEKIDEKIFVIGGSQIYNLLFDHCHIIHMTIIHEDIIGSTFFPYDLEYIKEKYYIHEQSRILYSKNENIKYEFMTFYRKSI